MDLRLGDELRLTVGYVANTLGQHHTLVCRCKERHSINAEAPAHFRASSNSPG